jgi:hypothetical protein
VAAQSIKTVYRYCWKNNCKRLTLFDRTCRIIATGKKNSALVEFTDSGQREIVSRYALRKALCGMRSAECGLPVSLSNNRQIKLFTFDF